MAAIILGNALSTNGTTQYAGRAVVSTANDNFSVMCWAKITTYPTAGEHACPVTNGDGDANGYRLQISDAGVYNFDFSFVANLTSGHTLTAGVWYHLAAIRTSGTTQLYVDATARGSTSTSTPNAPGSFVTIGAGRTDASTTFYEFEGLIDDVRFYNRAITTAELTQLYNRSTNTRDYLEISTTNLVSHWKMDEGSGTNCADSSASAAPLTTVNSPTFALGKVEIRRITPITGIRPRPFAPGVAR